MGSVLKSPSGALFRVTSRKYIDAFLIVVGGELIINNPEIDQPVGIGVWIPPIHLARLVEIRRGGEDMEKNIAFNQLMEQEKRGGI